VSGPAALALDGLTALFERLSIERGLAVGAAVGRIWVRVGGPRTRRVRDALEAAYPALDRPARDRLVEGVFVHLARGVVELLLLRGRRREALLARVGLAGLEHLEAATRASPTGGVLVVTAHVGNWELACAKIAALGVPISVVHRDARGPAPSALKRALVELRERAGREVGGVPVEQIPMGRAGRRVGRALAAGRKVLVLLDQDAHREPGVFVDFFGRPAATRTGPIALAAARGVPVVPAFVHRSPDALGHRIEIGPALEIEADAARDEAALRRSVQRATAAIEASIRQAPEQWIWTHRRWRTRPAEPASGPHFDPVASPATGPAGGFAGPRARV
jgi:KDO2-lipid IV(A) lauroyltransferase